MRLLPSSKWQSTPSPSSPALHLPQSLDLTTETPTFLSSFWNSYVLGNPPVKRSLSSPPADLVKRKDKTTTITETDTITETIFINQTFTIHKDTTIWSTKFITSFQSTTITHNMTMTTPLTVSVSASSTTPTLTTKSNKLPPPTQKAELANPTTAAAAASASASPSPIATATQHHLSPVAIAGIVFGALALVGLIIAGFWLVRRFYRMYRRERVLRKQLQMEGNEMPGLKTGQ